MAYFIANGRRGRRNAGVPVLPMLILLLAALSILLFLYNFVWSSASHQAQEAVRKFYEFERTGDYGSAWELFHSQMQKKFPKEQYIQQRAHVYMQQLGATTFRYETGDTDRFSTWSMEEDAPVLNDVYRLTVTQHLHSIFGFLAIAQDVYVAKEDGEWKLLWSYSSSRD